MAIRERHASLDDAAISHYRLVAPIMERNFGKIPIFWTTYPNGPQGAPHWHGRYFGHYSKLSSEHLEHLVAIGAREFYGWAPVPDGEWTQCRFARLLLEWPNAGKHENARMKLAALTMRAMLAEDGREAIAVLDGVGGIALWVPVGEAPDYCDVREWANRLAAHVVERHGDLISTLPNTHNDERVHLHVHGNAVGLGSILPYSMREPTRRVATPIRWLELGTIDIRGVGIDEFPARMHKHGDIFGDELAIIHAPPIPAASTAPLMYKTTSGNVRGAVVQAAIDILSDGKTRSAEEILEIARERKLIKDTRAITLYEALWQYIERCEARGRKPALVKTIDRKFRINQPADRWPSIDVPAQPAPSAHVQDVIARLRSTGDGDDPAAFEVAVCDAFAMLNFLATHLGGHGAPDGYLDAPLGVLGYRVMIECKSGSAMNKGASVYEAAKYKDAYNAQYCALVGLDPGDQQEVVEETKTHGVSVWGVDDIALALEKALNPLELMQAFQPGVVAGDVLPDILWQRDHGSAKRARIIVQIIQNDGWTTQLAAAHAGMPSDAPLLTEDAAMLLVDQTLAAQGCQVACSREDVRTAFAWLTSPIVGNATWNADKTAIVVVQP